MKHLIFVCFFIVCVNVLLAQKKSCYTQNLISGKALYSAGKYNDALSDFEAAKECPDVNIKEITEWIEKTNSAKNKASIPTASKLARMYSYIGDYSDGMCMIEKKGKYGYINIKKEEVVPAKYSNARDFYGNRAWVERNGKWGVIDKSGRELTQFKYTDFYDYFRDGVCITLNEDGTGLIDETGRELLKPGVVSIFDFYEGYAKVTKDGKVGYIDKTGRMVIPLLFDYDSTYIGSFVEGLACVKKDKRYGYIDKSGSIVIPFTYYRAQDFSESLALVTDTTHHSGFINKKGEVIIPFDYFEAESFSEGLAMVRGKSGLYGYINKEGDVAIPFIYSVAGSFKDGKAKVVGLVNEKPAIFYIDKKGNRITN